MSKLRHFPDQTSIDEEAVMWVIKLDGGNLSADEQEAFREWRGRSPLHEQRFLTLAKVHMAVSDLHGPEEGHGGLSIAEASNLLLKRRPATASGAAMVLLGTLAAGTLMLQQLGTAEGDSIRTAVGEQLERQLEDGSALVLNTRTDVTVDYDRRERRVVLGQGEALFEVTRNPERPFVVIAGGQRIQVLGTIFSVLVEGDRVEVLVEEGLVQVLGDEGEPLFLSPKQHAVIADGRRSVEPLLEAELAREMSWRSGSLVFAETPLEEVVAEVSRYTDTRITIAEDALADITIDGYFPVGEVDALFEALELGFGIEVVRAGPGRVELHSASEAR